MDNKKTFYVTTPIYYPSGQLHIGHAYTTTLCDILKRYKQLQGYDTFFLTGSDEHGQKIQTKAHEAGLSPMDYLNPIVENFKDLWTKLDIGYDKFIRTTDNYHEETVAKIFEQLLNDGHIYLGEYEGMYCVSCEEFLTQEQIDENGLCKISGTKPQIMSEETYFLKLSSFVDFVTKTLKSDFLMPDYRGVEMLKNFVEPGLKDLSVTRTTFDWGIPILNNPKHVIYVWIDALVNYITALGYKQVDDTLFKKFWADDTEIVQFVGKEIVRFHSIYWPVILEALGLRLPNHLIGHGWILSKDTKMSKSLGNVIDPLEFITKYGSDALRFYIGYELPTDKDGNFTQELFEESFNAHLANNVGNLISRTHNMITKYFDGKIKKFDFDQELDVIINQTVDKYQNLMDQYNISEAIRVFLDLGLACNKFIEVKMPWNLEKENKIDELATVLGTLQKAISVISMLLSPVLTRSNEIMIEQCGFSGQLKQLDDLKQINEKDFIKLGAKAILFERIK